jgi:hypothetical protein
MMRKTTTTIGEQLLFGGIVQVFQDTNGLCALLRASSILFLGPAFCLKVWLQVLTKEGQCTLYIAFNGRFSGFKR